MTTPLKKATFVCIDCETTGLDPKKDRIIEVAAIRFTLEETLEEFETLIDPECEIPPESHAIHHIHSNMLQGKPKIEHVLPTLFKHSRQSIVIGHGIGFDIDMIMAAAKRATLPHAFDTPSIDTLRLARHYGDSPNNSLQNLAHHFNVEIDGVPHRAMTDVKMNIEVFKQLVYRFKTVEELFALLKNPIKMKYMPLGKYKGRLFSEVPLQYLQWAVKLDFDQDLIYTIQQELKKRRQGGQFNQATNPFMELL